MSDRPIFNASDAVERMLDDLIETFMHAPGASERAVLVYDLMLGLEQTASWLHRHRRMSTTEVVSLRRVCASAAGHSQRMGRQVDGPFVVSSTRPAGVPGGRGPEGPTVSW